VQRLQLHPGHRGFRVLLALQQPWRGHAKEQRNDDEGQQ
jgi:hypothetical protein